ncbi:VOC family protein [Tenacibaculum sp. 190524A05c]|uniref:Glyoxalase/fosfomycin resistance/dioxygenase domain-containing protein n=1 Tax=Tenacibaculum platacis TaxID=3137852 RepID=A0ABM9NR69_9FLAO
MNSCFHMSLPCKNIEETINYYKDQLESEIGRKTENWVDINLFGHQLTFVLTENFDFQFPFYSLDDEELPSFHFGVVLDSDEWENTYDKINSQWMFDTVVKKTFFEDKNGEQSTFIVQDPNGYYIEFKTFRRRDEIFI